MYVSGGSGDEAEEEDEEADDEEEEEEDEEEEDEEEEDEEDGEALGSGEAADDDAELYPRRIPVNARAHAVAYICTEALKREERICL